VLSKARKGVFPRLGKGAFQGWERMLSKAGNAGAAKGKVKIPLDYIYRRYKGQSGIKKAIIFVIRGVPS
jgi:hypothetical protein